MTKIITFVAPLEDKILNEVFKDESTRIDFRRIKNEIEFDNILESISSSSNSNYLINNFEEGTFYNALLKLRQIENKTFILICQN